MITTNPVEPVNKLVKAINEGNLEVAVAQYEGPDGKLVQINGTSSDVLRCQTDRRWLIALDNSWGTGILG